jgi:hypothetical protein
MLMIFSSVEVMSTTFAGGFSLEQFSWAWEVQESLLCFDLTELAFLASVMPLHACVRTSYKL